MSNKLKEEFYDIAVRESSDLIGKIKKHPFNVKLMSNTLDYVKFKFYLQQDFLYVVDCTCALLIIAAKFNDVEIKNILEIVIYPIITKNQGSVLPLLTFLCALHIIILLLKPLAASYPCFNIYQIIVHYMMNKVTPEEVRSNKYKG